MQPPPQHPSIRARHAFRFPHAAEEATRPAPAPQQPRAADARMPSSSTTDEPIVENESLTPVLPPPTPPRLPDAIGRTQSEPPSIATALRTTTAAATLAVPSTSERRSSSSDNPPLLPSRTPSPFASPRIEHEGSPARSRSFTAYNLDNGRPSISLYASQRQEEDIAVALEELQQLELDDFLQRMSKTMEEVNFEDAAVHVELPSLASFRDVKTGKTDYLAFAERWACSFADMHLPRDLVTSSRPNKFSFSRTRTALERLYVLLPPVVIEKILAGELVKLYRWHDPLHTAKYAIAYLACWYYDQLPAAIFALIVYQVAKPRIWPPSPAEVRSKLAQRQLNSREAHDLQKDISKKQAASELSHSIAASVGIAAVMGGININSNKLKLSDDEDSSSSESGTKVGKGHVKKRRGKYGLYKLVRELISRFGPAIEVLMVDAADFIEKVKNLLLWRRPAATKQSLILISLCSLILSIMPGYLQLKLSLLWIWFQFFIIWPLQDRHPRYRRALNPVWYLLWNVPNDTECALELLQARAQSASEAHTRHSSDSQSSSALSERPRSISSLSHASTAVIDAAGISKHFALLKGVPGHLLVTDTELYFQSMKGFRGLSSRLFKGASGRNTPSEEGDRTTILFRETLSNIRSVKKEARFEIGIFDADGLHMQFASGKIVRLASVSHRNEAFATILARSTRQRSFHMSETPSIVE